MGDTVYAPGYDVSFKSMQPSWDGGFIILTDEKGVVIKLDRRGKISWRKKFGEWTGEYATETPDRFILVTGQEDTGDNKQIVVVKIADPAAAVESLPLMIRRMELR